MTDQGSETQGRNFPLLNGSGATSVTAWTLASPGVVLAYIALALELPMFLAGSIISIYRGSSLISDVFFSDFVSRITGKKNALVLTNIVTGLAFLAVIFAVANGSQQVITIVMIAAVVVIGLMSELDSLIFTGFLSEMANTKQRMTMYYIQNALGGVAAIALVLLVHQLMIDQEPAARHVAVMGVAVVCFALSALSLYPVSEAHHVAASEEKPAKPKGNPLTKVISNARRLFREAWFRKFLLVRFMCAATSLSVPFFALLAAEAHHSSKHGLTWLVVSSAAGLVVAAPLWGVLNRVSDRLVMVITSLLVTITGGVLVFNRFVKIDTPIEIHAIALFVVTVATVGLFGAMSLFFMSIAPKSENVQANAISRILGVLFFVAMSTGLAAIAHTKEAIWAVALISAIALATAIVCFINVTPVSAAEEEEEDA